MAGNITLVLLLLVAALALRGLGLSTRRRAAELASMDATPVADLHAEAAAVREQLGRGALDRPCKVAGAARPEGQPLLGPLSGQPVLWYDAKVVHHYWKDHYTTDKHGNQQHRRTRQQEVLSHQVSGTASVLVDDGTGHVAVDLAAARLDGTRKLIDQMRPHAADGGGGRGGPATIGYAHVELALLPGDRLFVTGNLRERQHADGLEVVGDGKKGPLVSTRTEAEVVAGRRRVATAQTAGAVVCAVLAVVAIVTTVAEALQDEPARRALTSDRTAAARTTPSTPPRAARTLPPTPAAAAPAADTTVDFQMPDLVGVDLQSAQDAVQALGVFFSTSHDLAGSRSQLVDSNWQVCDQTPVAGTRVTGPESDVTIDFGVVRREEACP